MAYVLNSYVRSEKSTANKKAAVITGMRGESKGDVIRLGTQNLTSLRIAGLYGHNPLQNQLLASLPADDFRRLQAHLEFVAMPFGITVCEAESQMRHIYFLTSSIVSLFHDMKDGSSAETAIIGNEGVLGVALFMGDGKSINRASVKSAGYGFRLKASMLMEEFARGGALQLQLLRYTQTLLTQMSQTAVCNRHHSVPQQLCRSLLLTLDRLPGNEISVTQNAIAAMLGVRRESVAEAAGKLQEEGLIQYTRGHLTVLDRSGLEARACECYHNLKHAPHEMLAEKQAS
ncbi:cAMP-binding proteins - catabolite gene activator and regulatory subunit of cAMP-dependent protein kinase [Collimonas arenae]|uniref:cAMP-binding proteins-catabolite gene activator and regulatory subunit of cAMP-dependent protein kinase n=1 Tax=Collimonas arenae TaxID=279058 RepID=A0A0A1F6Y5_9BURK|nr:cAMP-binding proteins - catabolite gene activator and regulatory subunit of cAMP-dependent protein kinase [Collimonas arenae]